MTAEDFLLSFLLRYPEGLEVLGTNGQLVTTEDFTQSENRQIFRAMLEKYVTRTNSADLEDVLPAELLEHLEALQAHTQHHKNIPGLGKPEPVDLFSIRQTMTFQLDRVREARLRQLYEQGSQQLEESGPESDPEALEGTEQLWTLVNDIGAQLRIYYPKPSTLFQDTRSR